MAQKAKNSQIFLWNSTPELLCANTKWGSQLQKQKKPGNDGCSQHRGGLNSSGVPRGFHDPKLGDKRRCGMLDWNPAGTGWASSHRGNISRNTHGIPEEWEKARRSREGKANKVNPQIKGWTWWSRKSFPALMIPWTHGWRGWKDSPPLKLDVYPMDGFQSMPQVVFKHSWVSRRGNHPFGREQDVLG